MSRHVRRGFRRERFTELVAGSGMSRGDLARLSEVSASTIAHWVLRGGDPDIERLARVTKVLGVEVSELVQVADDECMPADLRMRRGLTQVQLASLAGLSTTVVSGFERAETRWSKVKADKLARVLGVSTEELRVAWERARARPPGAPA